MAPRAGFKLAANQLTAIVQPILWDNLPLHCVSCFAEFVCIFSRMAYLGVISGNTE